MLGFHFHLALLERSNSPIVTQSGGEVAHPAAVASYRCWKGSLMFPVLDSGCLSTAWLWEKSCWANKGASCSAWSAHVWSAAVQSGIGKVLTFGLIKKNKAHCTFQLLCRRHKSGPQYLFQESEHKNTLWAGLSQPFYFKIDEFGNVLHFKPAREEQEFEGDIVDSSVWTSCLGSRDQYSRCEPYRRVKKDHQQPRRPWHVWKQVVLSSRYQHWCNLQLKLLYKRWCYCSYYRPPACEGILDLYWVTIRRIGLPPPPPPVLMGTLHSV